MVEMADVIANSYKDFHTKGLDYICLKRSDEETIKFYFFEGDVTHLPEVVSPHDHRYDFDTTCMSGGVENIWFEAHDDGQEFNRFAYMTPLNGGTGFTWIGTDRLKKVRRRLRQRGESYSMKAEELHTIRITRNNTVIMLTQYSDVLPISVPTHTYIKDREPPSLTGMYSRFTADEITAKMKQLRAYTGFVSPIT